MNLGKIDKNIHLDKLINAFSYLMISVMKFMMLDYYIEKTNIFIDNNNIGLLSIPFKLISGFIDFANNIFNGRNAKIYILNPSYSLVSCWNMIKVLLTKE